jgi:hypothetical protein
MSLAVVGTVLARAGDRGTTAAPSPPDDDPGAGCSSGSRDSGKENAMLRSIKEMLSYSILATDGEIGTVSDVLVADADLKLRYLVIDTGTWLPGRKVLLSTAWLSSVEPSRNTVVVNIEKKRIKEAPPYDPDEVINREYEERLHDHYGYPYYWTS